MAYTVVNSRGDTLAVLQSGEDNTAATSITLLGPNYPAYGLPQNENFVYLLENFAKSTSPTNPIAGQLWFDTSTNTLYQRNTTATWTALANNDYVQAQKISPVFTGIPQAPTAANATNSTQLATTAFVQNVIASNRFAPIENPTFTGTPRATTPVAGTNDTSLATTAFVNTLFNNINLSPYATKASPTLTGIPQSSTPDISDNSARIATTGFTKSLFNDTANSLYATKLNAVLTGIPIAPTANPGVSTAQIATTEFVHNLLNNVDLTVYAPKASPIFTGTPTAPTPSPASDNSTRIATTEFVQLQKVSPAFTGVPTAPTAAANTSTTQIATTEFVTSALSSYTAGGVDELAGSIKMWASANPPANWALCNGQAVSRTTYATLFSRIGTTYGAGDGSTTFNVPDFRNRFPVGAGSTYSGGNTGGYADAAVITHTHAGSTNTVGNHQHSHVDRYFPVVASLALRPYVTNKEIMPSSPPYNGYLGEGAADLDNNYWLTYNDTTGSAGSHNHSVTIDAPAGSVSGTGRNLPPYLAGWWIIKLSDDGAGGGTLQAGAGIDLTTSGVYTTITNVGVKNLTAGSGISITGSAGNLTINNTGSLPTLTAGQGINISQSGNAFVITNTVLSPPVIAGTGISVTNTPGGAIVNANVNNIIAGTGISVTNNNGAYTINSGAPAGSITAWAHMNNVNGFRTLLGSYNINSVSVGSNYYYTFNFVVPMQNSNYCVVATVYNTDGAVGMTGIGQVAVTSQSNSSFTVYSRIGSGLNVMVTGGV